MRRSKGEVTQPLPPVHVVVDDAVGYLEEGVGDVGGLYGTVAWVVYPPVPLLQVQ